MVQRCHIQFNLFPTTWSTKNRQGVWEGVGCVEGVYGVWKGCMVCGRGVGCVGGVYGCVGGGVRGEWELSHNKE